MSLRVLFIKLTGIGWDSQLTGVSLQISPKRRIIFMQTHANAFVKPQNAMVAVMPALSNKASSTWTSPWVGNSTSWASWPSHTGWYMMQTAVWRASRHHQPAMTNQQECAFGQAEISASCLELLHFVNIWFIFFLFPFLQLNRRDWAYCCKAVFILTSWIWVILPLMRGLMLTTKEDRYGKSYVDACCEAATSFHWRISLGSWLNDLWIFLWQAPLHECVFHYGVVSSHSFTCLYATSVMRTWTCLFALM